MFNESFVFPLSLIEIDQFGKLLIQNNKNLKKTKRKEKRISAYLKQ